GYLFRIVYSAHRDLGSSEDGAGSDSGSDFEDSLWKGSKGGLQAKTPGFCPKLWGEWDLVVRAGILVKTQGWEPRLLSSVPGSLTFGASHVSASCVTPYFYLCVFPCVSCPPQSVVDDWLESYKQNKETGFLELINFFIRSCGCKGESPCILRSLTESCTPLCLRGPDSAEYPLILTTRPWRKFRAGFCELVAVLVQRCQYSIMYDEYLLDNLISLLTGLSDSQVRAFRHTSTLAAMKLMTALVRVAVGVSLHKDNSQRQYEAERSKGPSRRATDKLEALLEKRRQLQEQQDEIENMMNAIFKGVFVHRYRDMVPEIRAICIEEMGNWMQNYSVSFLTDGYLKYIGWTLHDKVGAGAWERPWPGRGVDNSVEWWRSREVQRDREGLGAGLALSLSIPTEMLTDEDCEAVYPVVYASNRALAAAAGEFLYRNRGVALLLAFFIESELHEHAAYLVDSLWDSIRSCDKQGESQLPSGMRQATEGKPPVGRGPGKKVFSARERKTQEDDREKLTHYLIPLLPQLLAKFSADAEKVALLLQAPRYFKLSLYSSGRLEKYLEQLLAQVREVVEKHTGQEVLEAAARALYVLCNPEFTFYSRVDFARSHLVDMLADKFQQDVAELLQVPPRGGQGLGPLGRGGTTARDYEGSQVGECMLYSISPTSYSELPLQVVVPTMTCLHFSILWELAHITGASPAQVRLGGLAEKGRVGGQRAPGLGSCPSQPTLLPPEAAFVLLSDLLVVFSPQLVRGGREALQLLIYEPEVALQSQLAGFLMDHVFNHTELLGSDDEDTEGKIHRLHQRRNLLAGFCKLIIYDVLELSAASDVFKHYAKFYKDYGDIIKETLSRTRQIDRDEWARTILLSLQQLLTEMLLQHGPGPGSSKAFLEIRDLARRFSLLFGPRRLHNRQALFDMHKAGIKFAFQEPAPSGSEFGPLNLPFLELLSEFSPLSRVVAYLGKTCQARLSPQDQAKRWPPILTYRRSLISLDDMGLDTSQDAMPRPQRRPDSAAKKRRLDGEGQMPHSRPVWEIVGVALLAGTPLSARLKAGCQLAPETLSQTVPLGTGPLRPRITAAFRVLPSLRNRISAILSRTTWVQ
uniref:Cohesin subunit SA n=1 Tax=Pelusios castaneus TaxID=367368 RepID=A0A8C8RSE0_9SAUR